MADAKLKAVVDCLGSRNELRYAKNRAETWPGYDDPLGRKGFWFGSYRHHRYVGPTKADAEKKLDAVEELDGHIART